MTGPRAIMARGRRGQVGMSDGSLPWGDAFPEDRREFRRKTAGGILIAGWKTWRRLPGAVMEAGRDLVLDPISAPPGAVLDVLRRRDPDRPIFVIGGPATWRRWFHYIVEWDITELPFDGPADVWWGDGLSQQVISEKQGS